MACSFPLLPETQPASGRLAGSTGWSSSDASNARATASNGTGEVFSHTIVIHSTHPGTREVVPYNAIVVKLNDCGRMKLTSNMVECENEEIHVGMPVELVWEDTTPEVTMPRFRPARKG